MSKTAVTAPSRIYLIVSTDPADALEDAAFPDDHNDITWCEDDVGSVSVEYVRADLAAGPKMGKGDGATQG